MTALYTALRPFISRFVGTLVGLLAAWLALHGVDVDHDTQAQIVEALVLIIIPLFSIVREVVHRLVDKRVNPADAAGSHLAAEGRRESTVLKARAQ